MTKCISIFLTAADEVVESGREMARLKQSKVAQYKEKRTVTPIQGVLHKFRSDKKHSRNKMQSLGSLKVGVREQRVLTCKRIDFCFKKYILMINE